MTVLTTPISRFFSDNYALLRLDQYKMDLGEYNKDLKDIFNKIDHFTLESHTQDVAYHLLLTTLYIFRFYETINKKNLEEVGNKIKALRVLASKILEKKYFQLPISFTSVIRDRLISIENNLAEFISNNKDEMTAKNELLKCISVLAGKFGEASRALAIDAPAFRI